MNFPSPAGFLEIHSIVEVGKIFKLSALCFQTLFSNDFLILSLLCEVLFHALNLWSGLFHKNNSFNKSF